MIQDRAMPDMIISNKNISITLIKIIPILKNNK